MTVLGIDREWKANEKASPRVAFKVGLLHDNDPDFTRPGKQLAAAVAATAALESGYSTT